MSTILDALRKLQRERTAAHPSRDLRGSITDEIPLPRSPRRSRRRGVALAGVALLLAAAGGGVWLVRSGKLARHSEPQVTAGDAEDAAATEEALEQVERETIAAESEMDRATAAEAEAPAAVAAPPAPTEPAPVAAPAIDPAAEARAERARLEAIQAEAAVAAEAQRQAEIAAAARALPPAPPPVPVPLPAPTESRAQETAAAAPSAPLAAEPATPSTTPTPVPQPKAKPKPAPKRARAETPAREPARREPPAPALDDRAAAAVTLFPLVRVESIRWHPISERRVATLRFEQQNVTDAHEGDIVGGVLVYRIDPGAVEIRVGSTSRVIRPTP